jgi:LPXTG-site transpeptidase (sortase) family protein
MSYIQQLLEEFMAAMKYRKVPFFIAFFIIVLISYAFLFAIDFIPEPLSEETLQAREAQKEQKAAQREISVRGDSVTPTVATSTQEEVELQEVSPVTSKDSLPTRIIIDSLDVDVSVLNPQSRDIAVLDQALLSGVVRHPDSASFAKAGNMLILGHSSYLPNVMNKNFQAFNGIQKMTWGDKIRVQSEGKEYIYRVSKVYQAKASEITVPFTPGKAMLTLATCNSFGSKEDRFMVEATLLETKDL